MASILIVEDDLSIRYLLKELVRQMGHQLISAVENTDSAIEFLKTSRPDLILLDLILPGGQAGTGVLNCLKTGHNGVKVIIVTGLSEETVIRTIPAGSYDAVIHKPFTVAQARSMINSLLEHPGQQPPGAGKAAGGQS